MPEVNTLKLKGESIPQYLQRIPGAPKELHYSGIDINEWLNRPKVAIVGSRKVTPYGREITHILAFKLAREGIVIVSGLAYGVDAIAHRAALEAGGITVAVLPTSIEKVYPAAHLQLAQNIRQNGALVTEYSKGSEAFKSNFIARNRLVSGLVDVLLITEAAVNSGSLHTARFALEQGKTVMAVPGNINSLTSAGCNNLIKSGAIPVTEVEDVLFALNLDTGNHKVEAKVFRGTPEEEKVYEQIRQGIQSQENLVLTCQLDATTVSSALTMLEINGFVRPQGAGNWSLS